MENEYCKNLKLIESAQNGQSSNKCESIQLVRIYSPHLLPIKFGALKSAASISKSHYFLCVLDEKAKLNHLRERADDSPNKIRNDNLNDALRWMDYSQLKHAQYSYCLMGIEPLLLYKQYLSTTATTGDDPKTPTVTTAPPQSGTISTAIESILYEPTFSYFPVDQSEASTPAEQLIVSAKFNRSSTLILELLL